METVQTECIDRMLVVDGALGQNLVLEALLSLGFLLENFEEIRLL